MTSNTSKLRAVFLTALMIGSVFGAGIAFTGSVAAAADDLTVTNTDGEVAPGGTVNFEVTNNSSGNNGPIHVWIDSDNDDTFNTGETNTTLTGSSDGETISDSLGVNSTTGERTLAAAENASLTSGTTVANTTTTFMVDETADASIRKATHYTNNSKNLVEPKNLVELAFTENVTSGTSVTLYHNGEEVTSVSNVDDATDGRITIETTDVYTSGLTVSASGEDAEGNSISIDNRTVTTTVKAGFNSDIDTYKGGQVAIVADSTASSVEISSGDGYFLDVGTGKNSKVYVWNTAASGVNAGTTYSVNDNAFNVTVRTLDLNVAVDDTSITTESDITFTATAQASGRSVTFELLNSDGDVVEDKVIDTSLDSDAQVSSSFSVSDAGNYSVRVTDDNTGVTATSSTAVVSSPADTNPQFTETLYEDERGDIINVTVDMNKQEGVGVIQFGSEDASYQRTLKVTDGSDADTEVTIQVNTYKPSQNSSFSAYVADSSVDTEDHVEVTGQAYGPNVKNPLAAIGYDLSASTTDGTETSVSTVNLQPRTTPSVTTMVAPSSADLSSASKIDSAATAQSSTALDDQVVFQVSASSFEGFMADSDYTATNLNNSSASTGVYMTLVETSASGNEEPTTINVSNATVVKNLDSNEFYVAFDTSSGDLQFSAGESYEAAFVVDEDSPYVDDTTTANDKETFTASITTQTGATTFDGLNESNYLNLAAADNVSVSGTSNYAPGTNISVAVRSSGNFLKQNPTVTVQEDGTWSTSYDLADTAVGTEYMVTAPDATSRTGVLQEESTTTTTSTPTSTTTSTSTSTPTSTATPTSTSTATPTSTDTPTDTTTSTSEEEDGGIPGFGMGIALVAVLGAALLALRE